MENILSIDLSSILLFLSALYPPLLYLLPVSYANKINVGITVIKNVADLLDTLKNTKQGLTPKEDTEFLIKEAEKTFIQKSKN